MEELIITDYSMNDDNSKTEKLVVMDYSDGTVNIYNNPPDKSTEELLKDYGHDIDRCGFMFWQGEVTVKVHE